jgi:serine/threonine protein kinase
MSSPAPQPRDPLVGTRIDGRYIVVGVLGRGGMGVVYDGMHEQLGRAVAIKVLGPGVAGDANAVQRFLREARIASQLTHGNIVEVSDLGNLPDGRPYLVMAKLQGTDLTRILEQQGTQSPGRTVELLRGAAAALDLVHAKGFVHRDVKPENLMHVVREDGSEAVLLLDFGIVGLVSPDSQRLTADGVVFGTPCYLAPEVVSGETPSPASDTYALATVAYELITGRAPFVSSNVMQLLQLKMTQDPPRMSVAAGFRIDPAVEQVVATSLARDPKARHRSPGAFVAALAAAIETSPTDPSAIAPGLDAAARARLTQGSGELELSFDRSVPPAAPSDIETKTTASFAPKIVRLRKPQLIAALLGALVFSVGGLWLVIGGQPTARQVPIVVSPMAAAESAEPPRGESGEAPSAWPSPTPSKPGTVEPATSSAASGEAPSKPSPVEPATSSAASGKPASAASGTDKAAPTDKLPSSSGKPSAPSSTADKEPRAAVISGEPPSAAESAAKPPASAAALVTQAQDELLLGHMAAAESLYEQATRADPQSAAAFRGLGLVYERRGKKSQALQALRRAIASSPSDPKNALLREHIERLEAAP